MTESLPAIRSDLRARIKYQCGTGPAPSALPPSEPQDHCERSRLATCSLPVSSAEALLLHWHLEAEQMDKHSKHWEERNEPSIAGLCRGTADGLRKCVQELRRELGLPYPRQPEENAGGVPRPESALMPKHSTPEKL